ncbi:MAG: hypothetical protein OXF02_03330 [Simkaniaceae bacterium]|nr:hypothetical protein [Simkaniaceae bacterium]
MWDTIEKHPLIRETREKLREKRTLLVEGLWDSPKALLALLTAKARDHNVLVITSGEGEMRLLDDLAYFSDRPVFAFPPWETLPGEKIAPSPDTVGKRLRILHALEKERRVILLAPLQAVLQKVPGKDPLRRRVLNWHKGESVPFDSLATLLTERGYRREHVAVDKGEFAIRGGILDIFSLSAPAPYRIEFFDDEITSMRTYDPASQRSVKKEEHLLIVPANETEAIEGDGGGVDTTRPSG